MNEINGDDKRSIIAYYAGLIKFRLTVLEDYACKRPRPDTIGRKVLLLEMSYIQIRKILELVMYMSVAAHDVAEVELTKRIKKSYNADKIVDWLSKISPEFFPCPIDIEPSNEDGIEGNFVDARSKRKCLSPEDLKKFYIRSAEILHEQPRFIDIASFEDSMSEAVRFIDLTKNLFQSFSFEIPIGNRLITLGHLQYDLNEPPIVAFAKISLAE